jgi:phenylacetate-CoA ligase
VPAYQQFLAHHDVNPATIRTMDDFRQLPVMDKTNYLRKYPLTELCWDGTLAGSRMISVSSGSTGQPFFWPRGVEQDHEGAWLHERIYRDIFEVQEIPTLLVICFSMGTWIAGSHTTSSTMELIEHGLPLNIVTPGIEKAEAIKAIKHLAPHYKQIILAGYPPLTKDIIDEGRLEGINWRSFRTRFLWAGEAISEEWRSYVLRRVGSKDAFHDGLNIFGSADAAMLGHETPVSILARRLYNRRPAMLERQFNTAILPSLAQYYPERRFFESVDDELVFSARAGIPLLRYNIHDTGGVMSYDELTRPIAKSFAAGLERHGIAAERWQLPFVYLRGRKDFTTTIYGVNIYPENIRAALMDARLRSKVTGKFTMATGNESDMAQYIEFNIELARQVKPSPELQQKAEAVIVAKLVQLNAEFRRLYAAVQQKATPRINLISWGQSDHFAVGVKHRWVKN